MTLGSLLTDHRVRLGLTQENLAERAGLGVRTIRDLERGRVARPRPSSLTLLADALGLAGRDRGAFVAAATGASSIVAVTTNRLPPAPHYFVGRESELRELSSVARTGTPVTLHGCGGVGKTALAVKLAASVALDCPDGALYVDLRGRTAPVTPAAALRRLLKDLGAERLPDDTDALAARFRELTTDRHLFVLLDNAADEAQARALLPARGCVVVVTSRREIDLDGAYARKLGVLSTPSAVGLLVRLTGTDEAAATRLVAACGRTPMAIRLVAAQLLSHPQWTAMDLVARLGFREAPVRASLELSRRSLSPEAALLLRGLTLVDVNPVPAWFGARLAGLSDVDASTAWRGLADARLVEAADGYQDQADAYRVHDLVRRHTAEPASADDVRAALDRAARAAIRIASTAEDDPRRCGPLWTRVRHETAAKKRYWYDAAMALLRRCHEIGLHQQVWRLSCALSAYQERHGLLADWDEATTLAVASGATIDDTRVRILTTTCRASLVLAKGRVHEAHGLYARARTAAMRIGEHAARLHGEIGIATVRARLGRDREASEWFGRILDDPHLRDDVGVHAMAVRASASADVRRGVAR